jgi:VWFA-related protein
MDISRKLYRLARTEMQEMAKSSGGKTFPVAELREARSAFEQVAQEIGTQYSLGYYSNNPKRDGSFRKIRVELKGLPPGAQVKAREGYLSAKN